MLKLQSMVFDKHNSRVKDVSIVVCALIFAAYIYQLQYGDLLTNLFGGNKQAAALVATNSNDFECVAGAITDKTVILRVDDVQAYSWSDTSMKMINDAIKRDIPLTLGVIPAKLKTDVTLVNFLNKSSCNVEIAQHGFDHGASIDHAEPEFLSADKTTAESRISQGLTILEEAFAQPVVTWIPPQNRHSSETEEALGELGFRYISSEGEGMWDYDATTYGYDVKQMLDPEEVVAMCEEKFEFDNTCVIMVHPQHFANGLDHDDDAYQKYYISLLDQLQAAEVSFAKFQDFNQVLLD